MLNERRGGVILLGCELPEDLESLRLEKVDPKYLQEKQRNGLINTIKRIQGAFAPLSYQRERKILLEFVPVYSNPLENEVKK